MKMISRFQQTLKSRDHLAAFWFSKHCFFQLPTQRIQGVTAILNQHMRSIGKMPQIVTFSVFDAQAGDTVEQITGCFDSVGGGFEEVGDFGFGVDVQRRADAEIALERVVLSHGVKTPLTVERYHL
jgi:hypothetical protein